MQEKNYKEKINKYKYYDRKTFFYRQFPYLY